MGSSVCTGGPSGCASYSFRVVYFTSRGMARAETSEERKSSFLSSASFRSATSYASFRSFKSIKSNKSLNSRASFKSVVSRDDSSNYFSCHDSISTKTGIVNEGYVDNLSFYSVNDSEVPSIAAVAPNPRQRSISCWECHCYIFSPLPDPMDGACVQVHLAACHLPALDAGDQVKLAGTYRLQVETLPDRPPDQLPLNVPLPIHQLPPC